MTQDVSRERLDRLREDLAALRARTTAEFGLPPDLPPDEGPTLRRTGWRLRVGDAGATPPAVGAAAPATGADGTAVTAAGGPQQSPDAPTTATAAPTASARVTPTAPTAPDAVRAADHDRSAAVAQRPAPAGTRTPRPLPATAGTRPPRIRPPIARPPSARPPKPARRLRRPRVKKPARRLAVPQPILVRRRPPWLAGPRWPVWRWGSGVACVAVLLPAVAQMAYRLLQAMADTSILLGADPTRSDHLHAAAGVAGGGITLALAVAAFAVVKGRPGYLVAAGGVVIAFCVFPFLAHTAIAGVVSAPLPPLAQMITPPRWDHPRLLTAAYWLAAAALVMAIGDLVVRSALAAGRAVGDRVRR